MKFWTLAVDRGVGVEEGIEVDKLEVEGDDGGMVSD